MLALRVLGPWLFTFVFGQPWQQAGVYTSALAGWLLLLTVASPFANLLSVHQQQRAGLSFTASILGLLLVLLAALTYTHATALIVVQTYSLCSAVLWTIYLLYLLHVAQALRVRMLWVLLGLLIVFYGL